MRVGSFDSLSTKRVSFVLATKDRPGFVKEIIGNLKELVTGEDELVVVNQSRQDETLRLFEAEPGLVTTFVRDKGIGMFRAWNLGALVAVGKYIKWLTDDDLTYAEGMEQTVSWMDEHPEVDVAYCGGIKVVAGEPTQTRIPSGYGRSVVDVFRHGACLLGIVARRESLADVGLFDSRLLAADVDFMARSIALGLKVRPVDVCLYYHPLYAHSGTIRERPRWLRELNLIADAHGIVLRMYSTEKIPA